VLDFNAQSEQVKKVSADVVTSIIDVGLAIKQHTAALAKLSPEQNGEAATTAIKMITNVQTLVKTHNDFVNLTSHILETAEVAFKIMAFDLEQTKKECKALEDKLKDLQ